MAKDTWYKRIGWFLFYSAITLVIFFVIDLIVQRVVYNYENSNAVVYFIDDSGNKTTDDIKISSVNEEFVKVKLKIFSSVDNYYVTVAIDGMELNKTFEDTNILEFEIPSMPGEYVVTCNVHTNPRFGKEQDTLLTRKIIVEG